MISWSLKESGEVSSTQTEVGKLAAGGAPEGTVVVARSQTTGRGRHGRSWASPEGGLYMSLLLRPPTSERIQTLTLVASLAVARGIKDATALKVRLRWPNDVMIEDRKVAGVIAESSYIGQKLSFVAVGIGVNCNHKVSTDDPGSPAASLADEAGRKIDIAQLRGAILDAFAAVYDDWADGKDVVEEARGSIGTVGRRVVVTVKSGGVLEGIAHNIEPTGDLVLALESGKLVVRAEDVERLREG